MSEQGKRAAAKAAVDAHFSPLLSQLSHAVSQSQSHSDSTTLTKKLVLGIGSGSTIAHVVVALSELISAMSPKLRDFFVCVPTSFQSRQLLISHDLPIGDLERYPEIEVTIDGADEVDSNLNCIKGGGGCHLQEKIVAYCSRALIIVADSGKRSNVLGEKWLKGVPVEVLPLAYRPIADRLVKDHGAVSVKVRESNSKAGPCITDNGNMILDVGFGKIENPKELNMRLLEIPGVIETGLFVSMAKKAYFGNEDGSVSVL